ncbi:amidohydrolase family protein [Streptomyces sp. NPDC048603]|uniref:amidohydrolase family protein n=1 Tax=Streptomyces sp. NPDC048603 TaxID=3365577 RepID=UPI003719D5E7
MTDSSHPSRRNLLAGLALGPLALAPLAAAAPPAGARGPAASAPPPAQPPDGTDAVLLRGAELILTMDPAVGEGPLGTLSGADLLMRQGTIAAVGRRLPAPYGTRVLDMAGRIVMPGFVDIHNHLWQSSMRGGCSAQDLYGWLGACNRPTLARIGAEDMYDFVRLSALDVLGAGVTTVVDWVHPIPFDTSERYVRALADTGLRFVYAMAQDVRSADLVPRVKRELLDPLPLASAQVAVHAQQSALDPLYRFHGIARDLGVMLNSHVLEHPDDRGDDPIGALRRVGALGPHLLMNHAIHLTDDEIAEVAERDVRVAHCPLSNMRLASGIMRLPALHARGVQAGLGQDGGANDTSDMFGLMKAAVGLQRALHRDASVHPAVPAVLRMATLGGAECIGIADRVGSLTPGKRADVIVIDPAALNFAPRTDWTGQLVLNGHPSNVSHVFVDGRPRKAQGALVDVDVPSVVRRAERAAAHLRAAA